MVGDSEPVSKGYALGLENGFEKAVGMDARHGDGRGFAFAVQVKHPGVLGFGKERSDRDVLFSGGILGGGKRMDAEHLERVPVIGVNDQVDLFRSEHRRGRGRGRHRGFASVHSCETPQGKCPREVELPR